MQRQIFESCINKDDLCDDANFRSWVDGKIRASAILSCARLGDGQFQNKPIGVQTEWPFDYYS